ncbi:MAG: hypothetical protein QN162_07820 [Armatimonadota bacterium]|nr:hypothetical protein [Armatimonadota bacterium]
MHQRLELRRHHHVDEHDGEGQRDQQVAERLGLELRFAGEVDGKARRQRQCPGLLGDVVHHRAQGPAGQVGGDERHAHPVLAHDRGGAARLAHGGHVAQANRRAVGRHAHGQLAQARGRPAILGPGAHGDVELVAAHAVAGDGAALDGRADRAPHAGRAEPQPRRALPVQDHLQLALPRRQGVVHVDRPRGGAHDLLDAGRQARELGAVGPDDLHLDRGLPASDLAARRDLDLGSRQVPQLRAHIVHDGGDRALPPAPLHQAHEDLADLRARRLETEPRALATHQREGGLDLGHRRQHGLGAPHRLVRQGQRRAHGHLDPHPELPGVGGREELLAHQRRCQEDQAPHESSGRRAQCHPPVPQHPGEAAAVAHGQPLVGRVPPVEDPRQPRTARVGPPQPPRREHRRQREGHEYRQQVGEDHRQPELPEELSDDAPGERNGHEHRHVGHGAGHDGGLDLPGALARGVSRRGLEGQVPVDVLGDDDGVVDQHAHRHRQPQQRHDVDGEAREEHRQVGGDDGRGHGQGDDERAAGVVQEEENDHCHQHGAQRQIALHVGHRGADEQRLVLRHAERHVARQRAAQVGQGPADAVGHRHGVRPGLLLDADPHAVAAIEAGELLGIAGHVADGGHVAEPHCGAVAAQDAQARDLVEAGELPGQPHQLLARSLGDLAAGHVEVLGP